VTHAPSSPPTRFVLLLAVVVMCLVWGSTWVVIAEGLDDLQPFTSAAARFSLAAVVMCVVAALLAKREGGEPPSLRLVVVMGVLNFALSYGIVYWTETRLPSALTAVLWAVYPMMMAGVGHLSLPGERLRGRQWVGLAVGFAGVALLFVEDLAEIEGAGLAGAVLLISPALSAVGTMIVKRDGAGVNSLELNRGGMLLGAVLLCLCALLTERWEDSNWTPSAVGSVVYLALMGTCLTFGLYYWAMRWAPAYQLALIAYVTPVIAMILGAAIRSEPVTTSLLAGMGLVLAGVGLVMLGRRPRT
jgi:drug/metabolite transporter (DMT)-like permease